MTGRPSSYSPELAAELCARLAEGRSLRKVCLDDDMPGMATVFRWLGNDEHEAFRAQYARACEVRADADAEEIRDIADTPVEAYRDKQERMPTGELDAFGNPVLALVTVERTVEDAIAHRKLQVDTRKWLMAKMRPKRYGDKLELAGDASAPLQVVVQRIGASDERASNAEQRGDAAAALVERMGDGAGSAVGLGLADETAADLPAVAVRRLASGDQ